MGPGGRKRSLLLSFEKQSDAASSSAINRRCRSMQLTIAKTDGNVLSQLHRLRSSDRSRTLSDLLFDGCDAFRLDGWIIAESGQPMHIRFSAEPCNLALGIVPMRLLGRT